MLWVRAPRQPSSTLASLISLALPFGYQSPPHSLTSSTQPAREPSNHGNQSSTACNYRYFEDEQLDDIGISRPYIYVTYPLSCLLGDSAVDGIFTAPASKK